MVMKHNVIFLFSRVLKQPLGDYFGKFRCRFKRQYYFKIDLWIRWFSVSRQFTVEQLTLHKAGYSLANMYGATWLGNTLLQLNFVSYECMLVLSKQPKLPFSAGLKIVMKNLDVKEEYGNSFQSVVNYFQNSLLSLKAIILGSRQVELQK